MSSESLRLAGILFIVIPTIAFGGYSLLRFIEKREHGYLENPLRRAFFVAGHAHAGVLVVPALIALRYIDDADLGNRLKSLARTLIAIAPILMSAGFFLSMAVREHHEILPIAGCRSNARLRMVLSPPSRRSH